MEYVHSNDHEALEKISKLGESFCHEAKLPGRFHPETWMEHWAKVLESDVGVILHHSYTAALGGMVFTPHYTDARVAIELFWFCAEEKRGTPVSARLLLEFEKWGKERADYVMMSAIETSPELAGVAGLYYRRGFEPLETQFIKRCA